MANDKQKANDTLVGIVLFIAFLVFMTVWMLAHT